MFRLELERVMGVYTPSGMGSTRESVKIKWNGSRKIWYYECSLSLFSLIYFRKTKEYNKGLVTLLSPGPVLGLDMNPLILYLDIYKATRNVP